jgi:beta-phosphoglucomutase-like phosphatase (HAD superfamily)
MTKREASVGTGTLCIASSSAPERLAPCIEAIGIGDLFGANLFSASEVARGKPHPDIFLLAAGRMGADPRDCLVVEDSPSGIEAGIAAGMTVIGLLAGGHIRPGDRERLAAAGAHHIAASHAEVADLVRGFAGG